MSDERDDVPTGHADERDDVPTGHADEREVYLDWLRYLRRAVLRKLNVLTEASARWRPEGALISLLGIVNHLTHAEWRWIEGGMRGAEVEHNEGEFSPGPELPVTEAISAYREQGAATDAAVRSMTPDTPCRWGRNTDLRWVLIHLINETARHAGHADAARELLDGVTGE